MTLGERIMNLRMERQMSQSDLAEALDVSRQSISKWETDSSVPELEKLVMLCEIFGVSMDILVRGVGTAYEEAAKEAISDEEPAADGTAAGQTVYEVKKITAVKIAGVIMLSLGLLALLLALLLGEFLSGLLFVLPLCLCGSICVWMKNNQGLWCMTVIFMLGLLLCFVQGTLFSFGLLWFIGYMICILIYRARNNRN